MKMKQTIILLVFASMVGLTSCKVKPNVKKAKVENKKEVTVQKETKVVETPKVFTELKWYTSFEEASKLSNEQNKPIFAFFTGSDWCGWCIRLQKNVFAKPAFVEWANDNVILLELDFPKRTQLPEELKMQNYELANLFQVRGYPTVWLFTTGFNQETQKVEIAPLGSTGYPSGAVAGKEEVKFLSDANAILKNK